MTKITIDGPTKTRNDGSKVCIGYGIDNDGKVTGQFALPKNYEWDAPDATDSVDFVDAMSKLPGVHNDYKPRP